MIVLLILDLMMCYKNEGLSGVASKKELLLTLPVREKVDSRLFVEQTSSPVDRSNLELQQETLKEYDELKRRLNKYRNRVCTLLMFALI